MIRCIKQKSLALLPLLSVANRLIIAHPYPNTNKRHKRWFLPVDTMVVQNQPEKSFRTLLTGWKSADKSADHAPFQKATKFLADGALKLKNQNAIKQYRSKKDVMMTNHQSSRGLLGSKPTRLKDIFGAKIVGDLTSYMSPTFQKTDQEIALIEQTIKSTMIFDNMTEREFKPLVRAFEPVEFSKGEMIILQGTNAEYFYVLYEGEVSFEVDGETIGTAGSGKSFGELALLYACPMNATALTSSDRAKLFRVDQKTFSSILQKQTKQAEDAKTSLLKSIDFLEKVWNYDLQRLGRVMKPHLFRKDECLAKKGEKATTFFVIKEGQVVNQDGKTLKAGDYFGELSIISGDPISTDVTAVSEGVAYKIDRRSFERVLGKYSRIILKTQQRQTLERLTEFEEFNLEAKHYDELMGLMVDETFKSKNTIFESGKKTEAALYFVLEGSVQLSGCRKDLIKPGGYFGEEHLVFAEDLDASTNPGDTVAKYTAKVAPGSDCVCALLALSDSLLTLASATRNMTAGAVPPPTSLGRLPSLDDVDLFLAASMPPTLTLQTTTTAAWLQSFSKENLREKVREEVDLEDLDKISMIAEGQFGEVFLVRPNVANLQSEKFALKSQKKEDGCREDSEDAVRREIEVLAKFDHPFIVSLIHHYEDADCIYILMGLVPGGELFDVIHHEGDDGLWYSGLPEEDAKFYALMITDTLNYIHAQKYVYRDVKPENVLIDEDGYPMICDFGFAKYVPDKTYTLCGTPNYLAPEVISGRGHNFSYDHWSLGVLIFEMIDGENPFYFDGMDQMSLFHAIAHEKYAPLTENVSAEAKDVVEGLLQKDPTQRLGSLAGGGKDILKKPWFDSLNLRKCRRKQFKAPFIPSKGRMSQLIEEDD